MKAILLFSLAIALVACDSGQTTNDGNVYIAAHSRERAPLQAKKDSIQAQIRQRAIEDSLYRSSPEFKEKIRKANAEKAAVINKYRALIDKCYEGRTFNMNKWQAAMKKENFVKGKSLGDYNGFHKGYYVSIHMGAPTASANGWEHHWEVKAEKE